MRLSTRSRGSFKSVGKWLRLLSGPLTTRCAGAVWAGSLVARPIASCLPVMEGSGMCKADEYLSDPKPSGEPHYCAFLAGRFRRYFSSTRILRLVIGWSAIRQNYVERDFVFVVVDQGLGDFPNHLRSMITGRYRVPEERPGMKTIETSRRSFFCPRIRGGRCVGARRLRAAVEVRLVPAATGRRRKGELVRAAFGGRPQGDGAGIHARRFVAVVSQQRHRGAGQ
jgi:hypothetical protein